MRKTITTTVDKFIDAMERNGYPKAEGDLVRLKKDGTVKAACAMGQALLNLGVPPKYADGSYCRDLPYNTVIFRLNDVEKRAIRTVAKKYREYLTEHKVDVGRFLVIEYGNHNDDQVPVVD